MAPNPTFGRIGRYNLLGTLAEGGMARVYLAQKDDEEDMCVLKQLHLELEEHATASIRFQREAVIASKLNHRNIARVLDSGFNGSRFYMAMEFIAGQTIEDISVALKKENSPMPPSIAIAVVVSVLDGLDHAHDIVGEEGEHLGLVHRDLTPRNIMVGYDGDVKIIDFGLARISMEDDDFRTGPGVLLGTLSYMAPEQALTLDIDARSDLYSVGVVLWEMLAERSLIPPMSASETIRRVVKDAAPRLRVFRPELPEGLERVVQKALQKRPEERYQTAREFRRALVATWPDLPHREELGPFVRGLFSSEEKETRWLLDAAHDLHADHRNFFEDTVQDRYDPVPRYTSFGDSSFSDSLPDAETVIWSDDSSSGELDIRPFDPVTDELPVPLDRRDTDIDPLQRQETDPIRPVEIALRNLSKGADITFSLRQLPLDEALMILLETRFTGTLEMGGEPDPDCIYFHGGVVCGISPNRKLDAQLLGNALIDLKAVSADAIEMIPRGVQDLDAALLGRYLIQRGLIDEAGLERAHLEQARRRLYRLFERKDAVSNIREGLDQLKNFFPTMVDIRPVIAFGMVVCSNLERKNETVQRLRNRRVRMPVPYDETRNAFGLPSPIMEAVRELPRGVQLGPMPMLKGLDPMTTAGVLLLFDRAGLLIVESYT